MEKNLELGIKFSKEMGQKEFIGYFPDSFGHSKEIVKLVKKLKFYKLEKELVLNLKKRFKLITMFETK